MRFETTARSSFATGLSFVREKKGLIISWSTLAVIPCLWHRYIEAGDLGSHVYNAWLAQLIERGQAPGLYLATRSNNILFDISLLHVANVVGFATAEKIVVALCVLIFFWGVFAFVAAVTKQVPWNWTPCILMLAYGYSFNMGFMNYYVSVGLGCFVLALVWEGWTGNWIPTFVIGVLVVLAHPLGLAWIFAVASYRFIRCKLPNRWKLVAPAAAASLLGALSLYLHTRRDLLIDWYGDARFYALNGADQLMLYGHRYVVLATAGACLGIACVVVHLLRRRKDAGSLRIFAQPLELYAAAFCATALLPENLHSSIYAAWIGFLVSRLTTISAILGFCVLGCIKPQKWHLLAFAIMAVVFFSFLYQDTRTLSRMESDADAALSKLPNGTRIIATIRAPADWRVPFVGHLADRACIGRCFVYSNYEASSGQFRVRARKGSLIVTDSSDDSEDMQAGAYEIQETDPPLKQLYQCDRKDWTKLCLRDLAEGDNTGAGLPTWR